MHSSFTSRHGRHLNLVTTTLCGSIEIRAKFEISLTYFIFWYIIPMSAAQHFKINVPITAVHGCELWNAWKISSWTSNLSFDPNTKMNIPRCRKFLNPPNDNSLVRGSILKRIGGNCWSLERKLSREQLFEFLLSVYGNFWNCWPGHFRWGIEIRRENPVRVDSPRGVDFDHEKRWKDW